jgi:hypothetical protein
MDNLFAGGKACDGSVEGKKGLKTSRTDAH